MKNKIKILAMIAALFAVDCFITGCAVGTALAPNTAALPAAATSAQKLAAAKADLILDLNSPAAQASAQAVLELGGDVAIANAVNGAQRVQISNDGMAIALLIQNLLSQGTITSGDLTNLGTVFDTHALQSGASNDTYAAYAAILFDAALPSLQGASATTVKAWLTVFDNAALHCFSKYATITTPASAYMRITLPEETYEMPSDINLNLPVRITLARE